MKLSTKLTFGIPLFWLYDQFNFLTIGISNSTFTDDFYADRMLLADSTVSFEVFSYS
jgi:hypothetical protein